MRAAAYMLSFGGLFALWKLAGVEWMLAMIAVGLAYQLYRRVRYGSFVDFED